MSVKVGSIITAPVKFRVVATGLEGDAPKEGEEDKRPLILACVQLDQPHQHYFKSSDVEVEEG
jgi:hypothetical protein